MASLTLRPIADGTLNHYGSYTDIAEASADDDSTVIYQAVQSTSSRSASSSFTFGTLPSNARVTSATLYIRARRTANPSNSSGTLSATVSVGGSTASMSSKSLGTSYTTYSQSLSSLLSAMSGASTVTVTITTAGAKGASKDDTFYNRVTQAYIAVEYEQSADDGSKIYWKVSGSWSEVTLYKKVNGAWQVVAPENMPSGLWVKK